MASSLDQLPTPAFGQARSRLADDVAQHLRELILNGDIAPGTPLLQIQLAERLGVSRTPLREAFRILERAGLVRISNGNKTVEVVALDEHRLVETYEVRCVIDGLAAKLAAVRGLTPDLDRKLSDSLKRMEHATRPALSTVAYSAAHADFHLTILDASGNSVLADFNPLVRISSHMFLTRYLKQGGHPDLDTMLQRLFREANRDHHRIFEAIRKQNPGEAETVATNHINKTMTFAKSVAHADPAAS
jgi:GntR family transcriptional regulator, vanillate catabolism transcriptional regulator